MNNRAHEANVQTIMLKVRVRDEIVRNLVKEVHDAATKAIISARSKSEAQQIMLNMGTAFEKLNERIGELLRKLDDDEDLGARK